MGLRALASIASSLFTERIELGEVDEVLTFSLIDVVLSLHVDGFDVEALKDDPLAGFSDENVSVLSEKLVSIRLK